SREKFLRRVLRTVLPKRPEPVPARTVATRALLRTTRSATPSPVRSGEANTAARLFHPLRPITWRGANDVRPPVGMIIARLSDARRTARSGCGEPTRFVCGLGSPTEIGAAGTGAGGAGAGAGAAWLA